MGRLILGVLAGYIVMAAFVFVTFSLLYLVLGTEGSFQPESYDVSLTWVIGSIVLGFMGAVLGGYVAVKVGRNLKTGVVFAVIVFLLGIGTAIMGMSDTFAASGVRQGEVAMMDAMQTAKQPTWFMFLNPLLGVIGVLLGARCAGASKETARVAMRGAGA